MILRKKEKAIDVKSKQITFCFTNFFFQILFKWRDILGVYHYQGQSHPSLSHCPDPPGTVRPYATAPYCSAQLLSPQVCCGLFLSSRYSGATVRVRNIKRSPSNSLSLIPSLNVGNCSHHQLTSIRGAADTWVKCQPKNSCFSSLLSCLPSCVLPCAHKHRINPVSFPIHLWLFSHPLPIALVIWSFSVSWD